MMFVNVRTQLEPLTCCLYRIPFIGMIIKICETEQQVNLCANGAYCGPTKSKSNVCD